MDTKTQTTVAAELRAAAEKLRETARPASRGPWLVGDCELYPRWILSEGDRDEHGYNADVARIHEEHADEFCVSDADWQWMAFAHPGLAEPLAAWLEQYARWADDSIFIYDEESGTPVHESEVCDGEIGKNCRCFDHALAVARALNGGDRG